jgi:hypothetical protein
MKDIRFLGFEVLIVVIAKNDFPWHKFLEQMSDNQFHDVRWLKKFFTTARTLPVGHHMCLGDLATSVSKTPFTATGGQILILFLNPLHNVTKKQAITLTQSVWRSNG